MSGEAYRDWGYFPYIIDDIAFDISKICPLFGGVLSVSNKLIERFNYYRSGDIGIDGLNEAYQDWLQAIEDLGFYVPCKISNIVMIEESE